MLQHLLLLSLTCLPVASILAAEPQRASQRIGFDTSIELVGGFRSLTDGAWESVDSLAAVGVRFAGRYTQLGHHPWPVLVEAELLLAFGSGEDASGNDWSLRSHDLALGVQYPIELGSTSHVFVPAAGVLLRDVALENDAADYRDSDSTFGAYARLGYRSVTSLSVESNLLLGAELRYSMTGDVNLSAAESANAGSLDIFVSVGVEF